MFRVGIAVLFVVVSCAPAAEEEDPCELCEGDALTTCIAKLRDECETFAEDDPAHEACHEEASALCTAES